MAEAFSFDIDVKDFQRRFREVLPDATQKQIEIAFRQFMGRLEEAVGAYISAAFHPADHWKPPGHQHLKDAVYATVVREGSEVIGALNYDIEGVPYARIQDIGGDTEPHTIMPRNADYLWFPEDSTTAFITGQVEDPIPGGWARASRVNHPGSHITGGHYVASVLGVFSKQVNDDLEIAVAKAFRETFSTG